MTFWLIAVAILAAAGLVLAWPLLARGSSWRATGLALLLLLPLGGALLYRDAGTPSAMNAVVTDRDSSDFNALVDDLRGRLSERPEELEGWLLLGRSLKSLQRYDEALEALQTAQRISPDNPLVKVELAEAMLFASGSRQVSDEIRALLQSAVADEPGIQKGLWLLGIDAAQRGEDARAIEYWQQLLGNVDPNTPVAESVQEQIDIVRSRQGQDVAQAPPVSADDDSDWAGVGVRVELAAAAADALPRPLPEAAVLFVIVRAGNADAGPPLGVARIEQPSFPVEITIDDRHAMIPQRKLSEQPGLRLQARLSLSGQTGANTGDWESDAAETAVDAGASVTLSLASVVD